MGPSRLPEIVSVGTSAEGRAFEAQNLAHGASGRLRPVFEHDLAFANGLADRAADIGMGLFLGDGLEIRHKADRTVVTQADTSIEAMVREQLAAAFPDDHVLGEEEEAATARSVACGSSIRSTPRRTTRAAS